MQRMKHWRLSVSVAAVFGLLAAIGMFEYSDREPTPPLLPVQAPFDLPWRVGTTQHYSVQTDSSLGMSVNGSGAGQSRSVQLHAALQMRTLDVGPAEVLVGMQLSAVDLQAGGASDEKINRRLSAPFRVRFAPAGLPNGFEFPATLNAGDREVIENLLRFFQVTIDKGQTWVVQEENASGVYEAAYARGSATDVTKTKRRYVSTLSDAVMDVASNESIRIDAKRDWLASMTVDETVTSQYQGASIKVTNRATLELLPAISAPVATDAAIWDFIAAARPAPAPVTRAAMSGLTKEAAHKQLMMSVGDLDTARKGRLAIIHRLRDLLRAEESMPALLLEEMRARILDDRTRADLYLVFELAGTASAQAALSSVITDERSVQTDRMRAIVALSGITDPTEGAIDVLWSTARLGPASREHGLVAGTAVLALGSLGKSLLAEQDEKYPALRSALLSGTNSYLDPVEREQYVLAVGNTHDKSLAAEIVPLLNDPDPMVRAATAKSLGRLGSNGVANNLMMQFSQEKSNDVRAAMMEALVSWDLPTTQAMATLRQATPSESDPDTRFHMVKLLTKNLATFPENRIVLQDLLRTDQSNRIRQEIAEVFAVAE